MRKCFIIIAALLGAIVSSQATASAKEAKTRGIGVYPGSLAEYFGPEMVAAGQEYRNLALFRAPKHSSAIDCNYVAQLVTDGIIKERTDNEGNKLITSWKSKSNKNEWISVDLGAVSKIDKICFHWVNKPVSGTIQLSNDGTQWKDVATIGAEAEIALKKASARYVRVLLDSTANGEAFELAELEVFGRGGVKAEAAKATLRKDNRHYISGGEWKLCRMTEVEAKGEEISTAAFDASKWIVATVPGTVLGSYVNIGAVEHPNYKINEDYISDAYFCNDFWYRNSFDAKVDSERQFLHFCGINLKADVYLNGKKVGRLEGAFREFDLDVTGVLVDGRNHLAVKIEHNPNYGTVKKYTADCIRRNGGIIGADNPTMHATIGWDWLPTVRGRNMGIYDDVYIRYTGDVCVEDPFVRTELPLPDTSKASLIAQATVVNHSDKSVKGVLKGSFGETAFEQEVTLAPKEKKVVSWEPITLNNPKLWWPKGYGEQHLYDVKFAFESNNVVSDKCEFKSGVRQLEHRMYDYIPQTPSKVWRKSGTRNINQRLDIYINGRRITGFGGNWGFPEHLLNYRSREYDIAVGYHADMNFNMIRNWVGMTSHRAFYEACDRHGLLIWQDFWLANPGDGPDPADNARFKVTAEEYVRIIRNHPSICLYVGRNEGYPPKELDDFFATMVPKEHPGLYYIPHSGTDGVSGGGRYHAFPAKEYFNNMFGGDKLHSERGMPNVMNYENLVRAIGEENVEPYNSLEHNNPMYAAHDYALGRGKPNSAQRGYTFNELLVKAFGEPKDAREFTELAQWINYDGYRAIFEARSEYRCGVQLWMSHPSWPSMVWQTYDYFLEPTAGYFGCKKGCEPLHIFFNPIHNKIEVVNFCAGDHKGLKAEAQILDINGKVVWATSCKLDIAEDSTKQCFEPKVDANITDVYFIRLYLRDSEGKLLSENFYWQGKEEGNLKALRNVAQADVKVKVSGGNGNYTATITNKGDVPALMLRVKAVDSKTGDLILPVWYSENYIFLMGGESRTISIKVRDEDCQGKPVIKVEGFNYKK
jgi:hypothetical protein